MKDIWRLIRGKMKCRDGEGDMAKDLLVDDRHFLRNLQVSISKIHRTLNQHIIPDLAVMRFEIMIMLFSLSTDVFAVELGVWRASRATGNPLIQLLLDVADLSSAPVAPKFLPNTTTLPVSVLHTFCASCRGSPDVVGEDLDLDNLCHRKRSAMHPSCNPRTHLQFHTKSQTSTAPAPAYVRCFFVHSLFFFVSLPLLSTPSCPGIFPDTFLFLHVVLLLDLLSELHAWFPFLTAACAFQLGVW